MLASIPARTLNPIRSRRGIPRFSLFGKCSNLIRQGWIGANVAQAEIIERLVEAALSQDRSVTVGIEKNTPDEDRQRLL
jgi:hypothetical protein